MIHLTRTKRLKYGEVGKGENQRGILNIDQIKHKGYTVYSRHGNYTQTTNQGGVTKKKIL